MVLAYCSLAALVTASAFWSARSRRPVDLLHWLGLAVASLALFGSTSLIVSAASGAIRLTEPVCIAGQAGLILIVFATGCFAATVAPGGARRQKD